MTTKCGHPLFRRSSHEDFDGLLQRTGNADYEISYLRSAPVADDIIEHYVLA